MANGYHKYCSPPQAGYHKYCSPSQADSPPPAMYEKSQIPPVPEESVDISDFEPHKRSLPAVRALALSHSILYPLVT